MPSTVHGTIKIIWPPMKVYHVSLRLARTDVETGRGTISIPGEPDIHFPITIPSTFVRQIGSPTRWTVDACQASTGFGALQVDLKLPPEPCEIKFDFADGLYMDVAQIVAQGKIILPDARTAFVGLVLPECKSRWTSVGVWTVDEVVSQGSF